MRMSKEQKMELQQVLDRRRILRRAPPGNLECDAYRG